MTIEKPRGLYILDHRYGLIYGESQRAQIESLVDIYHPMMTAEEAKASPQLLEDMEILFSGWGGPCLDSEFLAAAKNLKAVFYAGGSIRCLVTDAFWDRGITISTVVDRPDRVARWIQRTRRRMPQFRARGQRF